MSERQSITAVVLAGGQGRRMAGRDKGLLEFAGRPLVEHALAALRPQVDHVIISANRNLARYRQYGQPVVCDAADRFDGPLAGILAALAQVRTRYLLAVPCDAPFLCPDYAQRMGAAAARDGALAVVAHDGERLQPVFNLLDCSLLQPLQAFLDSGQRRARDFLRQQGAVRADFSDRPDLFINLNRPDDLLQQANVAS